MLRAFLGRSFTAPKCAGDHSTSIPPYPVFIEGSVSVSFSVSVHFSLPLSLSFCLVPTGQALVDLRPTPEKEPEPGCFPSCFDSH